MQHIFIQVTKEHLFLASLSQYSQPNTIGLHMLGLSHVSLAPIYQLGSTSTRSKQPLYHYLYTLASSVD